MLVASSTDLSTYDPVTLKYFRIVSELFQGYPFGQIFKFPFPPKFILLNFKNVAVLLVFDGFWDKK